MTTTDTVARAAPSKATTRDVWLFVRTVGVRAGAAFVRATVTGWRYLVTVYALARLGLLWRTFCANTGLAVQRTHTDVYTGRMRTQIYAVPRLDYREERPTLQQWAARKGDEGLQAYWGEKNVESIDGLPALDR